MFTLRPPRASSPACPLNASTISPAFRATIPRAQIISPRLRARCSFCRRSPKRCRCCSFWRTSTGSTTTAPTSFRCCCTACAARTSRSSARAATFCSPTPSRCSTTPCATSCSTCTISTPFHRRRQRASSTSTPRAATRKRRSTTSTRARRAMASSSCSCSTRCTSRMGSKTSLPARTASFRCASRAFRPMNCRYSTSSRSSATGRRSTFSPLF